MESTKEVPTTESDPTTIDEVVDITAEIRNTSEKAVTAAQPEGNEPVDLTAATSKPTSPKASEQESQAQISKLFRKAKGRRGASSSPTNNTTGNRSPTTPTTNLELLYPERSSAPVPEENSEKQVPTTDSHDLTDSTPMRKRKSVEISMGIFRALNDDQQRALDRYKNDLAELKLSYGETTKQLDTT